MNYNINKSSDKDNKKELVVNSNSILTKKKTAPKCSLKQN